MPAITTQNLTKIYTFHKSQPGFLAAVKSLFIRKTHSVTAVDHISFQVNEGEFVGFIGPNGAGKTTTLKTLSGILHPTSGDINVLGFTPLKREKPFQKQFALVMGQKNQLWWDLPTIDSFLLFKAIYEIPDDIYQKNLDHLTELLKLTDILHIPVRKLSLGQRMKCELAGALLHGPKLLFLDEPTIGLDVVSQKAIRDFLKVYNTEKKATIILTSHYLEDIRRLCKRVIIINLGKIIYDGTYENLVAKYADTKILDMILKGKIPRIELEKYGEVISLKENRAKISIPRAKTAEITSKILAELPVEDLSIHEKSLEKIVREIFTVIA